MRRLAQQERNRLQKAEPPKTSEKRLPSRILASIQVDRRVKSSKSRQKRRFKAEVVLYSLTFAFTDQIRRLVVNNGLVFVTCLLLTAELFVAKMRCATHFSKDDDSDDATRKVSVACEWWKLTKPASNHGLFCCSLPRSGNLDKNTPVSFQKCRIYRSNASQFLQHSRCGALR